MVFFFGWGVCDDATALFIGQCIFTLGQTRTFAPPEEQIKKNRLIYERDWAPFEFLSGREICLPVLFEFSEKWAMKCWAIVPTKRYEIRQHIFDLFEIEHF